jgi:hypothetical protein
VNLVERVNAMHWDGPLRARLAVIARKTHDGIEVVVGLDGKSSCVLTFPKNQVNCDELAAATKRIIETGEKLVAAEVATLFRQGPKLELRVDTMEDVADALTAALGDSWTSPVKAIEALAQQRGAASELVEQSYLGVPELAPC